MHAFPELYFKWSAKQEDLKKKVLVYIGLKDNKDVEKHICMGGHLQAVSTINYLLEPIPPPPPPPTSNARDVELFFKSPYFSNHLR